MFLVIVSINFISLFPTQIISWYIFIFPLISIKNTNTVSEKAELQIQLSINAKRMHKLEPLIPISFDFSN